MKTKKIISKKFWCRLSITLILIVFISYQTVAENSTSNIPLIVSNMVDNSCEDCIAFLIPRYKLISLLEENELSENKTNVQNDDSCEYDFTIVMERVHNGTLRFSYELNPRPPSFEIIYWVENYDGNVVRNPFVTSNTNWKQFTPSFDENYQVFLLKSELSTPDCNKTHYAEKWAVVVNPNFEEKKEEESELENSKVEIQHIYSANTLKFGEEVMLRIKFVNLGNRDSIHLYVVNESSELISEVVEFDVFRNSNAVITQSIAIDEICKEDKSVSIIIEGFGSINEEAIYMNCPNPMKVKSDEPDEIIELANMKQVPIETNKTVTSSFSIDSLLYNISNFPSTIYSSRSQRTKSFLPSVVILSAIFAIAVVARYKL